MTVLVWGIFSNAYHSACVWPIALKNGCVTNVKMLFLVVGACLIDEKFMQISCRHFCLGGRGGGGDDKTIALLFQGSKFKLFTELSTESYGSMFKYERRTISRGREGYTEGTEQSIQ